MELLLTRKIFSPKTSIGDLHVDGKFECHTLEDYCRDLNKDGDLNDPGEAKVFAKTAIPAGRYQVVISFSPRFKRFLPLVMNVPGFQGIRIHPGNTDADTEGCILPGVTVAKDFVGSSRIAFSRLLKKMEKASKKEKIYITIR